MIIIGSTMAIVLFRKDFFWHMFMKTFQRIMEYDAISDSFIHHWFHHVVKDVKYPWSIDNMDLSIP